MRTFLVSWSLSVAILGAGSSVFAKSKSEAAPTASKPPPLTAEDVRCEKMMGISLYDFKATLVENCDLNQPYSTSLSRILNDEVYFYCCRKKTQ